MRLSEDKARRLNALVWRSGRGRVLPVIAVAIGAIALLTFFLVRQVEKADRTLDVQCASGTSSMSRSPATGRAAAIVEVRLDDGRNVEASARCGSTRRRHARDRSTRLATPRGA